MATINNNNRPVEQRGGNGPMVVLGIILALAVIAGIFFYDQNKDATSLEPAAGGYSETSSGTTATTTTQDAPVSTMPEADAPAPGDDAPAASDNSAVPATR